MGRPPIDTTRISDSAKAMRWRNGSLPAISPRQIAASAPRKLLRFSSTA